MLSSNTYIKITKVIFALVGLMHLLTILNGFTMVINGWEIPKVANIVGLVAAWYLAYNGYKLVHKN